MRSRDNLFIALWHETTGGEGERVVKFMKFLKSKSTLMLFVHVYIVKC
jgi:hypothetical protein